MEFRNDKEVFDYVRSYDASSLIPLNELLKNYQFEYTDIEELEKKLFDNNVIILDARSEKEFDETSIPCAVNFPVLKNNERHNVGLVYTKYSDLAAVRLAAEYADPKAIELGSILKDHAAGKEIIVHCWRGGGRSKYLTKMIKDTGYDAKILTKGIKSYRNKVVNFFNLKQFPYALLEISGLTGCGKTEIIRASSESIPAIDLENAARHFSSLFGYIPYHIRDFKPVVNQTAFENNIYAQILSNRKRFSTLSMYIIESESKKVGDFFIPEPVFSAMQSAPSVKIVSSDGNRINRIVNEYFGNDNRGYEEMLKLFSMKEKFFRKEMSNSKYESALSELKAGNAEEFTLILLKEYYDRKYRDKGKKHIAEISSDNTEIAIKELTEVYKSINTRE